MSEIFARVDIPLRGPYDRANTGNRRRCAAAHIRAARTHRFEQSIRAALAPDLKKLPRCIFRVAPAMKVLVRYARRIFTTPGRAARSADCQQGRSIRRLSAWPLGARGRAD